MVDSENRTPVLLILNSMLYPLSDTLLDVDKISLLCLNASALFQFILPGRTYVIVSIMRQQWLNLYIVPSPADYQEAVGLCGYINAPREAQPRLRDGTIAPAFNYDFARNWYVLLCTRVLFRDLVYQHIYGISYNQ